MACVGAIISKGTLSFEADGEEKRDEEEEKDLKYRFYPLQNKALPKYLHARACFNFSSVTLGVRPTWFTVGLSPLVSPKASWCSEDAVLPAQRGEVLPASW